MSKLSEAVVRLIATKDNALEWNDSEDPESFDCPNDTAFLLLNDFIAAVDAVERSWNQ